MADDNSDPAEREAFLADARRMTDRECLLQVIRSLGLALAETSNISGPGAEQYNIDPRDDGGSDVVIGSGSRGYLDFYAVFSFDSQGKAIEHQVLE